MANEKLISLSEVKKKIIAIQQYFSGPPSTEQDKLARAVAKMCLEEVKKIKPADAVEVVRCKDCVSGQAQPYTDLLRCNVMGCCGLKPNDFCSYGERRTDNA